MSWDPFLMKKLIKNEICGSVNSAHMHCSLKKVNICGYCLLNSSRTLPKTRENKKKKKKKKNKIQTWFMKRESKHRLNGRKWEEVVRHTCQMPLSTCYVFRKILKYIRIHRFFKNILKKWISLKHTSQSCLIVKWHFCLHLYGEDWGRILTIFSWGNKKKNDSKVDLLDHK